MVQVTVLTDEGWFPCFRQLINIKWLLTKLAESQEGRGGGFQDTGLCHSDRRSTTHKSGEFS